MPYTMTTCESERCDVPVNDMPLKMALDGINKQLYEADAILGRIMCNIVGAPPNEELTKGQPPAGMQEQVGQIDCVAARILSLSRRLDELLFGMK